MLKQLFTPTADQEVLIGQTGGTKGIQAIRRVTTSRTVCDNTNRQFRSPSLRNTMTILLRQPPPFLVAGWYVFYLSFLGPRGGSAFLSPSELRSTSKWHRFSSESSSEAALTGANDEQNSWSVADDWGALSEVEGSLLTDSSIDNGGETVFGTLHTVRVAAALDAAARAEREKNAAATTAVTKEDRWVQDMVDEIHLSELEAAMVPLYDTVVTDDDDEIATAVKDDMGDEIAMLIRCNEAPESMLIAEGRALPPLTQEEKDEVTQLVELTPDSCKATGFLERAVSHMFHQHAQPHPLDGVMAMTQSEVASWMTRALEKEGEGKVSAHDRRVLKTLSDFSSYGSGRLIEEDLQDLYLTTLVGDRSKLKLKPTNKSGTPVSPQRHLQLRKTFIDAVWRDIRAHGLLSPVEEQRMALEAEMKAANGHSHRNGVNGGVAPSQEGTFMDECEILDWDYRSSESEEGTLSPSSPGKYAGQLNRISQRGASSHKNVDLAKDNMTPLRMRDGEFVFIDEESCVGCYQCANVAPATFKMLESGRARTFHQRKGPDVDQAIQACPVACMHSVSFRELQEFEKARDEGDGRTDHRHLGHKRGHTPLHVAGMASDNNHRSSWYHTLKLKCLMSSDCPQKGCFDCPKYSKPGGNPFFIAKEQQAEHTRAQYFLDHGDVDHLRKSVDL